MSEGADEVQMNPAKSIRVARLSQDPIIHGGMAGLEGDLGENINGPSLIRVPEWVEDPLGKYYLYFAHHKGQFIRLAYADELDGSWAIHPPGVMPVADGPGLGHVASPDVHVDAARRTIRMYFHQPIRSWFRNLGQKTFLALSGDGLRFEARRTILGHFYFRVFRHAGWHYAIAKNRNIDGILYRSADGLAGFEPGPHLLPGVRHTAVWTERETLHLLYTLVGDAPERILHSTIDLRGDWRSWEPSNPEIVLRPELEWEGVGLPLEPSRYGRAKGRLCQLRDPCVFEENGCRYLLYSGAGESGIGIARIGPG